MLYLWIFGDNVEDRFGKVPFLIFYLLTGIAATFSQYLLMPGSSIPNVGASGAIAGVLGAYILLYPSAKVRVAVGYNVVVLPALVVLGLWIALQVFSGVGSIATTDETAPTRWRRLHGPRRRVRCRVGIDGAAWPRDGSRGSGVMRSSAWA